MEKTLTIIKPDAVERNLENKIISFFLEKNLKISKKKKIKILKQEHLLYPKSIISLFK